MNLLRRLLTALADIIDPDPDLGYTADDLIDVTYESHHLSLWEREFTDTVER